MYGSRLLACCGGEVEGEGCISSRTYLLWRIGAGERVGGLAIDDTLCLGLLAEALEAGGDGALLEVLRIVGFEVHGHLAIMIRRGRLVACALGAGEMDGGIRNVIGL